MLFASFQPSTCSYPKSAVSFFFRAPILVFKTIDQKVVLITDQKLLLRFRLFLDRSLFEGYLALRDHRVNQFQQLKMKLSQLFCSDEHPSLASSPQLVSLRRRLEPVFHHFWVLRQELPCEAKFLKERLSTLRMICFQPKCGWLLRCSKQESMEERRFHSKRAPLIKELPLQLFSPYCFLHVFPLSSSSSSSLHSFYSFLQILVLFSVLYLLILLL